MLIKLFNLQLFGEGGGDGAGDGTGAFGSDSANVVGESVSQVDSGKRIGRKSNPLANVRYGIQDSPQVDNVDYGDAKTPETIVSTKQSEDRATAFENLIKGEYKAEFDQRVQNIINKRFGENKRADEQMKQYINEQFFNLSKDLREKAKQVYIKNEALKVYDITNSDGKEAEKDLIEAKHALYCLIAKYDSLISQIKNYYAQHYVEFKFSWMMDFPTSREMIEGAIATLF